MTTFRKFRVLSATGGTHPCASAIGRIAFVVASLCVSAALPSFAALNCISNGDFENADDAYYYSTHYSYNNQRGGKPTGWTLSPNNRTGLVNEGTRRYTVPDLMGTRSLFLERRKNATAVLEARQSFDIPAPGKYRLSLNCCTWDTEDYATPINALAQIVEPGGAVTNALKSFKPRTFISGLEGIGSFMAETPALATYGAGNAYTLRLYVTETTSANYAYSVIDNVSFSLRTLVLGANETFATPFGLEPHDISLGADATLTYAPTTATAEIVPGKVTFAAGARIVFDMAGATADAYVMRTGGFALPSGESNPLGFIELANAGDYTLSLIEDGRTALIAKPSAPVSVTWTGAGDPSSLLDAGNWSAVPNASTLSITLGAAADWRGLGALAVSPAAMIDMNGNALALSGLSSAEFTGAAITNSAGGAATVLTLDVAAGATNENKSVAILGNVRFVKAGAGGFKASKVGQTYCGGTAVDAGTLIAGIHGKYRPFGASENFVVNGDFEDTGLSDTTQYTGASGRTPGWTIPDTTATYVFNAYAYWSLANYCEPQYEFDKWNLSLGKEKSAEQTFHVDEPGTYRLSFEYGPWIGGNSYNGAPTTVSVVGGGETLLSATVTPVKEVGFRQFFGDVEIAEAGDYTLNFAVGSSGNYFHADNVSFARKCEIAVGTGAALDMNGSEGSGLYSVVVAGGGSIKNSGSEMSSAKIGFADVTLTGDAAIELSKVYPVSGYKAAVASFDLGGRTNSVAIPSGKNFSLRDAEIRNGTFNVLSGGWLQIDGDGVDASTADFIVGSALRMNAAFTVRSYTARYNTNSNPGTAALNVLGTFTPETAYFYGCTMQDGSTIDLSAKDDAWSSTSSFTAGKRVVDYAPDATVNVEVGERELAIGGQVVSWTSAPPVEDNVQFALVRNGAVSETQAFAVQTNGLFVKRAAEPEYAKWDVATGGWKFYTASGAEVADWDEGVTANMQVRFSSYGEYAAIAATNVTPSAFILTDSITLPAGEGEIDMAAFPFDFMSDVTIDLNGRTLTLPEAVIGGTTPFTVTSSAPGGVLVADVAGSVNNTAMTLTGYVKLLKAGAGTLTASKTGQTYIGGTEATNGVLKCGAAGNSNPLGLTQTNLVYNGSFTEDTKNGWSGAVGWTRYSASGSNWIGVQAAGSYCHNSLPVGKYALIIGNQKGKGISYVEQSMSIPVPGLYRYSLNHAVNPGRPGNTTDIILMHEGEEDRILATVTPETTNTFTTCSGTVRIDAAGTYTFRICARKQTSTVDLYNVFDDISFMLLPEVRATGADATIDMNGQVYYYYYNFVLDGGTLTNTGTDRENDNSQIMHFGLESDSTMDLVRSYGFVGTGYNRGEIRLGGNTLTVNIATGKSFTMCNMTFDEGRVEIPPTTGKLIAGRSGKENASYEIAATNVDFSVGCALNLYAPMDVRGYEALYEGSENLGTQPLNVFGAFRPVTSNYYGCVLQNGSTLDLSGWRGAWPWSTTSAFTTGNNTVTFADGATIKVRKGVKGGKIVSWDVKPSNYDTLVFARDPAGDRRYRIVKKDDGIYAETGFMLIVR